MARSTFLLLCASCCLSWAESRPTAAELRRWEGSGDCTGNYTVLNTDKLHECTPYLIPAPASILVEYLNETAYASYHYQGVTDCSGAKPRRLGEFVVNSCEDLDGFSQMRVWVSSPAPPPASCKEPGDCGHAFSACCIASAVKGAPCACDLHNGTGEASSFDCGPCGQAFATCCAGFKLRGFPCTCDVGDRAAAVLLV